MLSRLSHSTPTYIECRTFFEIVLILGFKFNSGFKALDMLDTSYLIGFSLKSCIYFFFKILSQL